MAKPNYRQQKRQKELSRKSRQAEKLQRRTGKLEGEDGSALPGAPVDAPVGVISPAPPTEATTPVPASSPKGPS